MAFIELQEDLQRKPKVKTRLVAVHSHYIVKIEPRETVDRDGGCSVTLADGKSLNVVQSYKSLKKSLKAHRV